MSSLTPSEMKKIEEMYLKLKKKELSKQQAEEFKLLLEKKKQDALNLGDIALATGAVFLLAGLIGYVADNKD
ncbi:MAG: hypothetical protein L0H53_15530 [Candidatus Nitrosocosmicus sp.]|nr:hypothetical protein [Candidatus Nitrosocosmicus sp.]MDN5867746.1 hypothetical protein [Candidatus Nitrosocosmicus sp.]